MATLSEMDEQMLRALIRDEVKAQLRHLKLKRHKRLRHIQIIRFKRETNPLLEMARAADALGLRADRDDISERFDEFLRDVNVEDHDER